MSEKSFVISRILEIASDIFSNQICEDLPDDLQHFADKHPEWAIEYHTWNGDLDDIDEGETINQISILATWAKLQIETMENLQ